MTWLPDFITELEGLAVRIGVLGNTENRKYLTDDNTVFEISTDIKIEYVLVQSFD